MNMLKVRFVSIILVLQVVIAEYTNDSNSSDDKSSSDKCDGEKSTCTSNKSSQGGGSNSGNNNMEGGACNKCGTAYRGSENGRVINGRPVQPVFKYPWIVPLIRGDEMACGGALISATYVMTAGHCVFDRKMLRHPQCQRRGPPSFCYLKPNILKVGILRTKRQTPSERVAVRRIIPHPKFHFTKIMFDMALLQLEKPVGCGATVMPVCLHPRDFHRIGTKLITAGWGLSTPEGEISEVLREGVVTEVDPRRCLRKEQPKNYEVNLICADGQESGQSSCFGDSGSALFGKFGNKFYAVGVVSYGSLPMCRKDIPVAYHRVYTTLNFIKGYVKDLPRG